MIISLHVISLERASASRQTANTVTSLDINDVTESSDACDFQSNSLLVSGEVDDRNSQIRLNIYLDYWRFAEGGEVIYERPETDADGVGDGFCWRIAIWAQQALSRSVIHGQDYGQGYGQKAD